VGAANSLSARALTSNGLHNQKLFVGRPNTSVLDRSIFPTGFQRCFDHVRSISDTIDSIVQSNTISNWASLSAIDIRKT
jgi:hypothetical protein